MRLYRLLLILALILPLVATNAADKVVLFEAETNTSCSGCSYADEVIEQLVAQYGDDIVPVVYHAWWPADNDPFYLFNANDNRSRVLYYPAGSTRSIPYAISDGIYRGENINSWSNMITYRLNVESPVELILSGQLNEESGNGILDISINVEEPMFPADYKLRIALTEDSLYYAASNGTEWHNHTFRDMIPGPAGRSIEFPQSGTLELSQEFTIPSECDIHFCKLVVWIQADDNTHAVTQAASIDVEDMERVDIADQLPELPENIQLSQNYPNPFNATTTIRFSLANSDYVTLTIYDILGRSVNQLHSGLLDAGVYDMKWDGTNDAGNVVGSGMYLYNLETSEGTQSKRMLMMK